MGTLALIEFVTVDGVLQGLGSPQEDTEGGFTHGGRGTRFAATVHEAAAPTGLGETSAYPIGPRSNEKMAAFWPHQPDDGPMAGHVNATPKYVASRTLSEADWPGARSVSPSRAPCAS